MCSIASVLACVYMLRTNKNIRCLDSSVFEFLMRHSSLMFRSRFKDTGRDLFDVNDVISRVELKERFEDVIFSEFGGLTKETPEDMQTEHCMDLDVFLGCLRDGDACTITYKGHTRASGRCGALFWFFDSLEGLFNASKSQGFLKDKYKAALSNSMEYSAVIMKCNRKVQ